MVMATASSGQREAPHRPARAATLAAARARAGEGQDAEGARASSAEASKPRGPTAPPYSHDPKTPRTRDTRTPVHTLPRTPHPKTVRRTKIESGMPLPPKTLPHTYAHAHAHALLRKDTHNKTLRTDAQTLGPQNCPAHLAPHTFSGAREGVLVAVAAVKTRRRLARTIRTGPGSRHGHGA